MILSAWPFNSKITEMSVYAHLTLEAYMYNDIPGTQKVDFCLNKE